MALGWLGHYLCYPLTIPLQIAVADAAGAADAADVAAAAAATRTFTVRPSPRLAMLRRQTRLGEGDPHPQKIDDRDRYMRAYKGGNSSSLYI